MKAKVFMLSALVFATCELSAQFLSPQVLASSGDDFSVPGMQLQWTLGELATETVGDDYMLTEGFQQGDLNVSTATITPGFSGTKVYPNPVGGVLTIEIPDGKAFEYEVLDIRGVSLRRSTGLGYNVQVDMGFLLPGIYILRLTRDSEQLAVYKINKMDF